MSKKKKQTAPAPRDTGPPVGFRRWWEPTSKHEPSGADIGGHPDAQRIWARKEPGQWKRRLIGITADKAWLWSQYQEQYEAWVQAGKPKGEPFISIATSAERQVTWARELKGILVRIGKPMPKVPPKEMNVERQRMGLRHKMSEPLDERGATDDDEPIDFTRRTNEGEE